MDSLTICTVCKDVFLYFLFSFSELFSYRKLEGSLFPVISKIIRGEKSCDKRGISYNLYACAIMHTSLTGQ